MNKIDEFKDFVKNNPILIKYIRSGEMTWQKFYEIYDLYGDDDNIWDSYFKDNIVESSSDNNGGIKKFEEFIKMARNVDIDKVQDGLTSLQKTLSLFGDLFINKESNTSTYNPRPLYRRFDD